MLLYYLVSNIQTHKGIYYILEILENVNMCDANNTFVFFVFFFQFVFSRFTEAGL